MWAKRVFFSPLGRASEEELRAQNKQFDCQTGSLLLAHMLIKRLRREAVQPVTPPALTQKEHEREGKEEVQRCREMEDAEDWEAKDRAEEDPS